MKIFFFLPEERFLFERRYYEFDLKNYTKHVMSLPVIKKLVSNGLSNHHLIIAVIIILKHATTLRPSNTPEQALTLAQVDYKKANVGLKIQEYLKIFPAEGSVEQFADFIMATNIGKTAA
jgi:hypothetical protein